MSFKSGTGWTASLISMFCLELECVIGGVWKWNSKDLWRDGNTRCGGRQALKWTRPVEESELAMPGSALDISFPNIDVVTRKEG